MNDLTHKVIKDLAGTIIDIKAISLGWPKQRKKLNKIIKKLEKQYQKTATVFGDILAEEDEESNERNK